MIVMIIVMMMIRTIIFHYYHRLSWKMSRSDLLGLLAMIASDLILDELVGVSDLVLDVAFLCSAFWSFSVLPLDGLC